MELNNSTYYSAEMNKRYMSYHQYLSFAGSLGIKGCEARAMAELNEEWHNETTEAMLVGSYVDSYIEGTLDQFKNEHPEIFTQKGQLKAAYKRAEKMIERMEQDDMFMRMLGYEMVRDKKGNIIERLAIGEHQKIFTAELFGCEWKCKLDVYMPGICLVDLKTSSNLHQSWKVNDNGYVYSVSFVEYWGYIGQLALYQK